MSSEYHISKLPDLFNFYEKDIRKLIFSLRKGVVCYEYIDS